MRIYFTTGLIFVVCAYALLATDKPFWVAGMNGSVGGLLIGWAVWLWVKPKLAARRG